MLIWEWMNIAFDVRYPLRFLLLPLTDDTADRIRTAFPAAMVHQEPDSRGNYDLVWVSMDATSIPQTVLEQSGFVYLATAPVLVSYSKLIELGYVRIKEVPWLFENKAIADLLPDYI